MSCTATLPDDEITVTMAAALHGDSERTMWRRIADGSLPVHRYGRVTRIRRADFAAFVARNPK